MISKRAIIIIVGVLALQGFTTNDDTMIKENGVYIINTTTIGKDIEGYNGPTPLKVYIKNNNFRQGSTFLSDAKTYNWKLIQENNTGDIYLDYIDFMGDGPDSNTYNEL